MKPLRSDLQHNADSFFLDTVFGEMPDMNMDKVSPERASGFWFVSAVKLTQNWTEHCFSIGISKGPLFTCQFKDKAWLGLSHYVIQKWSSSSHVEDQS